MAKKRRKLNFKEFLVIAVAIIALAAALATLNNQPKACTEEAKLCPDGSAVGRVPPDCDFAPCPSECKCPAGYVQEGDACNPTCYYSTPRCLMPSIPCSNQSKEYECINSGGNVATQMCCKSANDFPNTCMIGACGCSQDNSHDVQVCDCGAEKCWNGTTCTPLDDNTYCESDSDCVGLECCHPTSCINKVYKGVCNMICTQVCQGPLDCGAGSCSCVNHKCTVIPK